MKNTCCKQISIDFPAWMFLLKIYMRSGFQHELNNRTIAVDYSFTILILLDIEKLTKFDFDLLAYFLAL